MDRALYHAEVIGFPWSNDVPMSNNPEAIVYQLIGDEGFQRLTQAFYRRVQTDDILLAMYPSNDMEGARGRLCDFLIYRFGGPQQYIEERGHPRLRARHHPFTIDKRARDRWVSLMESALDEVKLDAEANRILREFFANTATFLINQAPPPGGAGFAGNSLFPVVE